jgi:hypothetical protein
LSLSADISTCETVWYSRAYENGSWDVFSSLIL